MNSIKKNFLYSSILTTANYIFPFLTYPYISRILGVNHIGICNFVDSIINYFILFSMMGIGTLGVREIAKCKDNKEQRNQIFSSLFVLNTISTTIALIILIILIYTVPKLYLHKELMYIGALKLICNYLLIDWLYRGLEEFKYVTIRTIFVKCLYVVAIFVFIHHTNDYKIYYLISCLMITINAIFNGTYARKFIKLSFSKIQIKPYIHPFLILGLYTVLTSMYTSFNVAYLGFVSNETEVGYYTTATKLYSILLALFTAFTGVLLPRMSSLLSENKQDEFKALLQKSINILFTFSIPAIIISTIMAPEIIQIIAGKGYEGAITPMRIVMPLMLVIGYEQILVIQTLMPLKKDKAILYNSILGAITGILMNILLVNTYKSIGSSIVWITSELIVLLTAQHFVHKYINISFPYKILIKSTLYHIPLAICIYAIQYMNLNEIISLVIAGGITFIYCFILQIFLVKNELITQLYQRIIKKYF
jgi:O-antigen/teichoic acid export membrane protein